MQCFDLAQDPGETRPLPSERCPSSLTSFFREELGRGGEVLAPQQDAETEDALRSLGYIE